MKSIKIVLVAAAASLFSSCNDAIDIIQPGELSPLATFQTTQDLQKGLVGTYGSMTTIPEISFNSIFTDEVRIGFANGGQGLNDGTYGFVLNTNSNDAYNLWVGNYFLINNANRVLAGAKNVKPGSASELAYYNSILAQARLFRAWGHFRLLSYFSPNLTDPTALGVILMDHVPATNEHLPRSTNAEVYKFIEDDLAFADQYLNDAFAYQGFGQADNSERKYLSHDFITAFRARLYAYKGDYSQAGQYADLLINNTGTYPLSPTSDYPSLWTDAGVISNEIIFKLDRIYGDTKIGATWASVDATLSGSPFFTMSTDLFGLLNNTNDIRYSSFIGSSSDLSDPVSPSPKGKVVISKYSGSGNYALLNDEKVFRVSEMYFIKAEASIAAGDAQGFVDNLNAVITARFLSNPPLYNVADYTGVSVDKLWAEVLKQRRIELCYEGHRYVDLKRLGKLAKIGIARDPKDCSVNGACSLAPDDHRFTMPLPNDELKANPAIRSQQNPGY